MALTPEQIELIRGNWSRVAPVSDIAAVLFYGRLFRLVPRSRRLFKDDMASQRRKLLDTLDFVVDHLHDLATLTPEVRALAIRHVEYGVRAEHYAPVGAALIWTLRNMLGSSFGEKEQEAWTAAYGLLARVMIEAAHSEEAC